MNLPKDSECGCWKCSKAYDAANPPETPFGGRTNRFIVCEICGNKRCPHATDHDLYCTDSNDSGQAGSIYA